MIVHAAQGPTLVAGVVCGAKVITRETTSQQIEHVTCRECCTRLLVALHTQMATLLATMVGLEAIEKREIGIAAARTRD